MQSSFESSSEEPMFSHLSLECVLLLLLPLLTRSLEEEIVVALGQNAQLPCTYSLPAPGSFVPVCWGRGACPAFDCWNLILRTDEKNVTYMASRRYTLERDFHKGDVSLTITNVTLDDSGTYCCRVQFPGPFNDGKFNIKLVIRPIEVTPAPTAQRGWIPTLPRTLTTEGRGPETQTSGMHHEKNQTQMFTLVKEFQASGATTKLGVYITAGVSAVVALMFIFGALTLLSSSLWPAVFPRDSQTQGQKGFTHRRTSTPLRRMSTPRRMSTAQRTFTPWRMSTPWRKTSTKWRIPVTTPALSAAGSQSDDLWLFHAVGFSPITVHLGTVLFKTDT
ncbi:hepatitis A virus cellular receptor 2 homolog isoform X2 [Cavia porcellus]|uniref:hepatitis A virus cellular receptor 2 homolog isoform X2 n=1 Tax=Cavia porcellus TaxID=10141 RepID=UPI002FDF2422